MSSDYVIRPGRDDDIPQCIEMFNAPDLGYLGYNEDDELEIHYMQDANYFLVADKDDAVVGYLLAFAHGRKDVYLDLLVVGPEYRGNGLGRALLDSLHERIYDDGVRNLFLIAPTHNPSAIDFYRREGFEPGHNYTLLSRKL